MDWDDPHFQDSKLERGQRKPYKKRTQKPEQLNIPTALTCDNCGGIISRYQKMTDGRLELVTNDRRCTCLIWDRGKQKTDN